MDNAGTQATMGTRHTERRKTKHKKIINKKLKTSMTNPTKLRVKSL
jgi:hypothetical protein